MEKFPVKGLQFPTVNRKRRTLRDKTLILSKEAKHVLDEEKFGSRDFWQGYKLYCFARYSQCLNSKSLFVASKMGRVVSLLQKDPLAPWGSEYDEKVREMWTMMEEYAEVVLCLDWTNLRAMMEKFDDVKTLSSSENGCLLLQLVEDDDYGTERILRQSQRFHVQSTNIFDEMQGRLKRVGSNLDKLMETAGKSSNSKRKKKIELADTDYANR